MQLIDPQQSATAAALEIQQIITEISGFTEAQLKRIYELVNTPGMQQAILNRIGSQGVAALAAYVAFRSAMELVKPGSVAAPDPAVFVPQEDGTIRYVAPPEPTPPQQA